MVESCSSFGVFAQLLELFFEVPAACIASFDLVERNFFDKSHFDQPYQIAFCCGGRHAGVLLNIFYGEDFVGIVVHQA